MKRILFTSALLLAVIAAGAQESKINRLVVRAQMLEGDTIPMVQLEDVNIYAFRPFKSKRQARKMTKLMRNVKVVYPYARLAGIKLREYEEILSAVESEKEQRRIMKQAEDELQEEFGDDLRNLTISQGKILLKLVYRETGASSYDLVAELRGKFRAFFWQAFARIFGFNLKSGYDPEGEDSDIEFIVKMIEAGQL